MKIIRDYDKEPIIIKDRLPIIVFLNTIILFPTIIAIVVTFVPKGENVSMNYFYTYFGIICLMFFFFLYRFIKKDRKIIIKNNSIIREGIEKDDLLEIKIDDIHSINRTFIDLYDKSQKALSGYKIIYYILMPISILLQPILLVIKFFYKIFFGLSNKKIIDTLIFFDKNENIISLFLGTKKELQEVKIYFKEKHIDINSLPLYYTNEYSHDEITHFFNKKK